MVVLRMLVDVAVSDVGGQAQALLSKLGSTASAAVPWIVETLSQGGGPARIEAVHTLRAMGAVALSAAPALQALLKTEAAVDEALVAAAEQAHKAIRPAPPLPQGSK